ncbi:MAG: hypothetical protein E6Q68_03655 [Polynucleobacter sp.]|jgi:hypothetical protein|nr:MAG: hypothetical protein E6Q68_03655 [Polynucleobacter sp.]
MSIIHRHVEVMYCDDVRQEIGHKISLMGIYGSDLVVNSVPTVIEKLCLSVRVLTPINEPFKKIEIFVSQGEEDKQKDLVATGPLDLPPSDQFLIDGSKMFVVQTFCVLSPFNVEEETVLKVRVKTEREELRGVGLRIRSLEQTRT